ncbi:hypothetical protein T02_5446 [Trichinella nativa]|uniref:Uncharacterized protein n=1 Tax=Trichinella nativa TaxID=6335 RepID=A0A0V1LGD6_9BILA|nr:hypothetical protein T02_5446 [Trichinella nativa]
MPDDSGKVEEGTKVATFLPLPYSMPGLAGACLLLMDEFGTVWAYAVRGDDRNFQLKITLTPNMVDCCERANATTVNTFNGIDECFLTGDANFPKH